MKKEPIVFLLDLDGTLQGDVGPQVVEYQLINELNSEKGKKVSYSSKRLFHDMSKGLIRPYVKDALLSIKKKHSNVEFFVYTASSDEWAKFLLPRIIHYLFGKQSIINTPFLTRSDCIDGGKKSIEHVKPKIMKALKDKYKSINHIYLVDNNLVLYPKEMNKLILCPTYDYKVLNCPMRNLSKDHIENNHKQIAESLFNQKTLNHLELLKIYYDKAFKEYIMTEENNKGYEKDNYWLKFKNVMTKNRLDKDEDIKIVISKLQSIYNSKQYILLNKLQNVKSGLKLNNMFNIMS